MITFHDPIFRPASELRAGDYCAESSGFTMQCTAVTRERGMIVATFHGDYGMRPVLRVRPSARIRFVPTTVTL